MAFERTSETIIPVSFSLAAPATPFERNLTVISTVLQRHFNGIFTCHGLFSASTAPLKGKLESGGLEARNADPAEVSTGEEFVNDACGLLLADGGLLSIYC